jgi:hypothetical protein
MVLVFSLDGRGHCSPPIRGRAAVVLVLSFCFGAGAA